MNIPISICFKRLFTENEEIIINYKLLHIVNLLHILLEINASYTFPWKIQQLQRGQHHMIEQNLS